MEPSKDSIKVVSTEKRDFIIFSRPHGRMGGLRVFLHVWGEISIYVKLSNKNHPFKRRTTVTIFYFTGTGNSLFAAKKIAAENNAALISIPQAIHEHKTYTDDAIGFVYPQYANGLPKMVRRFIVENNFKAGYFFAVDLYAFIHINALGEIAALLPLNYGAYLKTPMNFIFLYGAPKNPGKLLAKAEHKLGKIINDIANRVNVRIVPSKAIGNATKHFGESKYKVTADCTKCGTCAKVCPAGNIRVDDDVIFDNNCETCFACVNLCPVHAIYSKAFMLKRRQYRNPIISVDEIASANSNLPRPEQTHTPGV